ncbi:hypothetical protein [Kitasatospora sp. NRRL B-11411]|uniref:LppU/SCO3897 family protein n=1 Tax=Kitasatospora sp. NRRL B-11411 TaxID=1463822 RepID=UPI00068E75F1|nr:hypothetical protein [Kitasatospora sp. NRRL B-11411]
MTRTLTRTAVSALALLTTGLLLVGCESAKNAGAAPPGPSVGAGTSPSPTATGPGGSASASYRAPTGAAVPSYQPPSRLDDSYFAEGSCARVVPGSSSRYETVPCDSPEAEAKVTKRSSTATGVAAALPRGADCPDGTDAALDLTQNALVDVKQNRAAWACLRNLHDPHPGDPGGGGGTGIVVGDCVYRTDSGGAAETRCDGKGEHPPQYKVDKVFIRQTLIDTTKPKPTCPEEATVSFTLPNPPGTLTLDPTTACAEPVD